MDVFQETGRERNCERNEETETDKFNNKKILKTFKL